MTLSAQGEIVEENVGTWFDDLTMQDLTAEVGLPM